MIPNETEFFREVTLRICSSLDIDYALSRTFEYLQEHIPADTMGLGYHNVDEEQIDPARIFVVAKVARKGARFIWADHATSSTQWS